MTTTLDKYGRVLIPGKLRKRLEMTPGTNLHISESGNRIIIEPIRDSAPLRHKQGILVYTGQCSGSPEVYLKQDREGRLNKLSS